MPPIVTFLAKHPLVANYDLTSIDTIISGAAPLGEELTHAVRERIPTVVALGQGMCHYDGHADRQTAMKSGEC